MVQQMLLICFLPFVSAIGVNDRQTFLDDEDFGGVGSGGGAKTLDEMKTAVTDDGSDLFEFGSGMFTTSPKSTTILIERQTTPTSTRDIFNSPTVTFASQTTPPYKLDKNCLYKPEDQRTPWRYKCDEDGFFVWRCTAWNKDVCFCTHPTNGNQDTERKYPYCVPTTTTRTTTTTTTTTQRTTKATTTVVLRRITDKEQPVETGGNYKVVSQTIPASDGITTTVKTTLTMSILATFMGQPGILAAIIGGALVGILLTIILVMFLIYRLRKRDDSSQYSGGSPNESRPMIYSSKAGGGGGGDRRHVYA